MKQRTLSASLIASDFYKAKFVDIFLYSVVQRQFIFGKKMNVFYFKENIYPLRIELSMFGKHRLLLFILKSKNSIRWAYG